MSSLPTLDSDRILASAARYLIDGGEEDAASVLLACQLEVWASGDTWYVGDEVHSALHVTLTGPRAAYEALSRESELDAYYDKLGVPQELREQRKSEGVGVFVPSSEMGNLPPIVRPAIERAIQAVLPPDNYVKHFTIHVEQVEIDLEWRNELLEIARGKGVTNQGVAIKDRALYSWQNLRFRSKTEIKIAEALDRANVMFLPNCLARLGVTQDYRINREADFLVIDKGRLGILEVHGEPFHPASRAAEDHERNRLFKLHGIKTIEVYDATRCYEMPDDTVADFLRILRQD